MEMREELDRARDMNARHMIDKMALTMFVEELMSAYEMAFDTLDDIGERLEESVSDDASAWVKVNAMRMVHKCMHESILADYEKLFGEEFE